MARLWRNNPDTPGGKYLVKRRDGTIPEWPYFVIGAADPSAPVALIAYAIDTLAEGRDPQYVADIFKLVLEFDAWREANGTGDPDAPRHRQDDPATVAEMLKAHGA